MKANIDGLDARQARLIYKLALKHNIDFDAPHPEEGEAEALSRENEILERLLAI